MLRLALLAPLCFTLAGACTVKEAGSAAPACNGPDCQADAGAAAPLDGEVAAPPEPTPTPTPEQADAALPVETGDAGRPALYPICQGLCAPDDSLSCADFDPDDELEARALYSDSASRLFSFRALTSAGQDAGAAVNDSSAASLDAGTPVVGEGNTDGSMLDTGVLDPDEGLESSDAAAVAMGWSCQIDRDDGEVAVGCWLSGGGGDGDGCTSTRDCQAGFACVGEPSAGECRKFCCEGDGACVALDQDQTERHHFCDERPLRSPNTENALGLDVPVCALADMCDLSEPFPCDEKDYCECGPDEACTVVNQQGATGCRVPGDGGPEEACPCQAGFYCHPVENTCKLVCRLDSDDGACGDSLCQATANFPAGYGLCQPVAPMTE
jgi:hypothetical protein